LRLFAQSSSYVYGRSVVVDSAEAVVTGTTDGLDESGFLWIRTDEGRRHLIRAGGVRPR
jgi:BirA family biotin operon repressor/biotin-[acetyl-CoA-carboxylase] ligase